jgi:plasmid stabilization system protein ParE
MKVEYSKRAVADIRKIAADSRQAFGDRVAEALEARIKAIVERVAIRPVSAPEVVQRPGIHSVPMRQYPYKIFYRILEMELG